MGLIFGTHSEKLHQRELDPDEQIRQEVVKTICETAAENIICVPDMVKQVTHLKCIDTDCGFLFYCSYLMF